MQQEVAEICKEIGLPDINDVDIPVKDVKEAITEHHYKHIKEELERSKKLKDIKEEDFRQVQGYFHDKSVSNGRMAFKIRSQMLPDIPANFKNKHKKDGGLVCKFCKFCEFCSEDKILSQSHCMVCPAWESQRMGLDLTKVDDLVTFFRNMLMEKERREPDLARWRNLAFRCDEGCEARLLSGNQQ